MIATFVLAAWAASSPVSVSSAPAEAWAQFSPYMGTWSASRTSGARDVSVVRKYEPVVGNQHLLVSEKVASDVSPWGVVSFDGTRGAFVLRHFRPDGSVAELLLQSASAERSALVFATEAGGTTAAERITLENHGSKEFVERVEQAAEGQPLTLVSETLFRRKW